MLGSPHPTCHRSCYESWKGIIPRKLISTDLTKLHCVLTDFAFVMPKAQACVLNHHFQLEVLLL